MKLVVKIRKIIKKSILVKFRSKNEKSLFFDIFDIYDENVFKAHKFGENQIFTVSGKIKLKNIYIMKWSLDFLIRNF